MYVLDCWKMKRNIDVSKNYGDIEVTIPARFDFIGGWTDTPPYYFDNDAAVLNTTLVLEKPAINIRISSSNKFVFIENNKEVNNIADHMVMLKTLEFCNLVDPDIRIEINNSIPKGSGLGGSSLLVAGLLVAILAYYQGKQNVLEDLDQIVNDVLLVEQMMGSGGGWQDQIGGIFKGIKLIRTYPDMPCKFKIKYLNEIKELNDRSLIIDTKISRRAFFILNSIRQKYIEKDKQTIKVLRNIKNNAVVGFNFLKEGNISHMAKLMDESWQMVNSIETNSSIEMVDRIKNMCGKDISGLKIGGAGGGGFILVIFEDFEKRNYWQNKFLENFLGCLVYEPIFGGEGLRLV